jgi:hypothetical protein
MKNFLSILLLFQTTISVASVCQAPPQGMMESRIKETFFVALGETELREWMTHPTNYEIRMKLKELDRRIKFSPQRLQREELLAETQVKFDQAIINTGRPYMMEHFPAPQAFSKVYASQGALSLEMRNLAKESLDFLPPEILEKLEPKVRVNYFFPYDKFDHYLTYKGKELPMQDALLLVQKDMEDACERRMIDNDEYRRWYSNKHGGGVFPAKNTGSSQNAASGAQ